MRKILFALAILPLMIFAQPAQTNRGNSLYGNKTPQSPSPSSSSLTKQEQAFAATLSPMHKTVFTEQFSPQQRQNAMSLVKMKDPLNTEPGPVTPDHAVEIILQSSRNQHQLHQQQPPQTQQRQSYNQPQQPLPDQYQPQNQRRPSGQQGPYTQPDGCRRY